MSLLSVKQLSVSFQMAGKNVRVVDSLSFDINESEIFGVVGESGSGKSMTALSIMGILPDSAKSDGKIIFKDEALGSLSAERRRALRGNAISMVFQEPMTSLNPVLTIGYQIAEVLTTHKGMSVREANKRAVELLKEVKIPSAEQRAKDYPHQMSGGMRQRVMIAMAIACKPELLIADEPTTALDVTIAAQILNLIHSIKEEKNMSVMFITHDLAIVSEHTDRVAIMYAGRIVELAKTDELFAKPLHPYTIGLLNSIPGGKGDALESIPGTVPRADRLPAGCKFSDRCRFVLPKCRAEEPELRDVGDGRLLRCIRNERLSL
ncbi:MAG: ABC transporter ATP-binding protein [Nitrospirae bacterium]|nr:ABC transporter ATP-binding protein [Nitrospirota bacterium]MBF0534500.1 ABC transporter ATP-binding protein [Nitrospirota bacterium]MBF0617126.1 ABC transporter ATP-binding protein [Nitrospirota bacterium]